MTTAEIQKKAKFVADSSGKPKEVILPYNVYKKLLALETSMEIFKQGDTQKSIGRAKEDIQKGRVKLPRGKPRGILNAAQNSCVGPCSISL